MKRFLKGDLVKWQSTRDEDWYLLGIFLGDVGNDLSNVFVFFDSTYSERKTAIPGLMTSKLSLWEN